MRSSFGMVFGLFCFFCPLWEFQFQFCFSFWAMFGVRLLIHFGLNFLPRLPRIFYTNDLYECYEEWFRMIMIGGGLILWLLVLFSLLVFFGSYASPLGLPELL